jgi:GxxExxY protein
MFLHEDVTDKILSAFYQVNNTLGYGFLEKVYERAMIHELQKQGCTVETQKSIKVYYDGKEIGDYFADMVVDNSVIVELKAAESLCYEHEIQLINYLRATKIEVGLLLNFGKKAEFKRKLFTNNRKQNR